MCVCVCVFVAILSTTFSEIFLIVRIIYLDIIKNAHTSECKEQILIKLGFIYTVVKNTHLYDFVKIPPVEDEQFHAIELTDGQTRQI